MNIYFENYIYIHICMYIYIHVINHHVYYTYIYIYFLHFKLCYSIECIIIQTYRDDLDTKNQ